METHKLSFNVFGVDGRIGRLKFAYVFFIGVMGFAASSAGMVLISLSFLTEAAYLAICVMLFWVCTAAVIKRFHDLNRPRTDFFFTFIPVYNIYIFSKLFFFRSKPETGGSLPKQSNAHYWQIPIIMLLSPALFFGIGMEFQMNNEKSINPSKAVFWYNEEYQFSLDHIPGVVINVITMPTDEKPYSEYTQEDFARLSKTFQTVEDYVKYEFKTDDDHVSMFADVFYRLHLQA